MASFSSSSLRMCGDVGAQATKSFQLVLEWSRVCAACSPLTLPVTALQAALLATVTLLLILDLFRWAGKRPAQFSIPAAAWLLVRFFEAVAVFSGWCWFLGLHGHEGALAILHDAAVQATTLLIVTTGLLIEWRELSRAVTVALR